MAELDGEGDYAVVDAPSFAWDGTFAISMWFYKASDCDVPEEFEFLFSTSKGGRSWRESAIYLPQYSGIHMFLGCAERGSTSTVEGNVLRTWLVDEAGTQATFDYSLSAARGGGAVTDAWVHALLQVNHNKLELFIDGEKVNQADIGYQLDSGYGSGGNWDGSVNANPCGGGVVCDNEGDGPCDCDPCDACANGGRNTNAAFPSLENLNPPLGRFDHSERYEDFQVYNYTTTVSTHATHRCL